LLLLLQLLPLGGGDGDDWRGTLPLRRARNLACFQQLQQMLAQRGVDVNNGWACLHCWVAAAARECWVEQELAPW
jgi:hypothetical protein